MSAKYFLDTNLFIYDVDSGAPPAKKTVVENLIESSLETHEGIISYQVIQEFLAVSTQKFAGTISLPDVRRYLEGVLKPMLRVHSSVELFRAALDIRTLNQLSWCDSLIVAAASEAGCSVIYTEDLQHGAKINGIRIENPFRAKRAH
jgi:predicted nucleic acid-binding protein